ncbi:Hypothetical protein D9617_4g001980 [Elsinoe fawcettii]|nr:Hypothetical protein D9617_4g001980 [Elsinoe fawcettii]
MSRNWFIGVLTLCLSSLTGGAPTDIAPPWDKSTGSFAFTTFHTAGFTAPAVKGSIWSPECQNGLHSFITPRGFSVSRPAVAIYNDRDELDWLQESEGQAYDLKVQEAQGKQYLTYWTGDDRVRGHGAGEWVVLNSSYELQGRIGALNGHAADLHELVITPEGTALLTIYEKHELTTPNFQVANSSVGSFYIWDCLFQEIDPVENKLLFEWRASDHYSVNDTYHDPFDTGTIEDPFDWFHINSVKKDSLGNYIISARYTHSITYIDGRTGNVLWILGGKRNFFTDFSDGEATNFSWQHDAHLHGVEVFPQSMRHAVQDNDSDLNTLQHRLLTLFDNAAEDFIHDREYSRGLLLELKYPTKIDNSLISQERGNTSLSREYTARLIKAYDHPDGISSSSQGSMQVIPSPTLGEDPTVLIGYGFNAVWTKFDSNGTVLCDTRFAPAETWDTGDVQSYRTFQSRWVGTPRTPPTIVLSANCSNGSLYVSWNGATEVRHWMLQTSADPNAQHWFRSGWRDVMTVPKQGFETEVKFDGRIVRRWLRVVAFDSNHQILGTSEPLDIGYKRHLLKQGIINALHVQKLMVLIHVLIPLGAILVVVGCFLGGCVKLNARSRHQGPLLRSY